MIYIHVPFCKQKCSYCNFHFSTSLAQSGAMAEAILREMDLRAVELDTKRIPSIYFGGGTPSLWSVDVLRRILEKSQKYFDWENDIEITLEANPDDLTKEFLQQLSSSSINRLSIGVQSFHEADLKLMNRAHSSMEAEDCIKRSQDFGFENLTIDLIYGSPVSDFEVWKNNLSKAVNLQIPHLSAYALTVEPKTALSHWIEEKKISAPNESLQSEEFLFLSEYLPSKGLKHYEISNFAKEGMESRHNSAYWKARPYLGLGPSAHSYDGKDVRSWNVANNTLYLKALEKNQLAVHRENLSEKDQYNERIMIGLRTRKGVDLKALEEDFSEEILAHFQREVEEKLQSGHLIKTEASLQIPYEHWFLADGISSDLFLI